MYADQLTWPLSQLKAGDMFREQFAGRLTLETGGGGWSAKGARALSSPFHMKKNDAPSLNKKFIKWLFMSVFTLNKQSE